MTTALTQGGNAPLPTPRVTVEVTAPKRLDVSGLLLAENGKVRSDADFVFFNAPQGPGVTHRPAAAGSPDAITVDTAAVPAEIHKVLVTASLDEAGATFSGTEPTATVRDADTGEELLTFTPPRLTLETALVVVEVYRRGGAWKVRAVGQGYADGLAGIATDFGVTVDDPGPAAPPAAQPGAGQAGEPAEEADWTLSPPSPAAPPATPAPAAAPAPAATPKVTLDKGRVSLVKGGSVSLVKNGRPFLSSVRMGLGWEPAHHGRRIDLDASCIAFDGQRRKIETAWFMKLSVFNGAIQHSGDNLTGNGEGDDEQITVHLEGLPPEVQGLVFTVNSFSGQKFSEVAKAYCRLVDASTGEELVRFDLTSAEPRTGALMCKLVRQLSGEWVMTALGEFADAKTARKMVEPAAAAL